MRKMNFVLSYNKGADQTVQIAAAQSDQRLWYSLSVKNNAHLLHVKFQYFS